MFDIQIWELSPINYCPWLQTNITIYFLEYSNQYQYSQQPYSSGYNMGYNSGYGYSSTPSYGYGNFPRMTQIRLNFKSNQK